MKKLAFILFVIAVMCFASSGVLLEGNDPINMGRALLGFLALGLAGGVFLISRPAPQLRSTHPNATRMRRGGSAA